MMSAITIWALLVALLLIALWRNVDLANENTRLRHLNHCLRLRLKGLEDDSH